MRHIDRLPKPQILVDKEAQWRERFLERKVQNPQLKRPHTSQYAHAQIRDTLGTMSHHKCFYCETKLTEDEAEVDHYVEVAEAPERAFDWDNLYLSCHGCNSKKQPNTSIPVTDCIDPCGTDIPLEHLTFDNQYITPRRNSAKGHKTIQKYHLDRDDLNHRRVRALQYFDKKLRQLHEQRGNRPFTEQEKEIIMRFKQPDRPFSLMFEIYLDGVKL